MDLVQFFAGPESYLCCLLVALFFLAIAWPRGSGTDRYEQFIAAPAKTVWDIYFVHVNKVDYRPGTRVLEAVTLQEHPLTVRLVLQSDLASAPAEFTEVFDLYKPYSRYRLHDIAESLLEEGEFIPEAAGTRLRTQVSSVRHGWILPWIARRRVRRNLRALKDVCEGRQTEAPRGALPDPHRWETLLVIALVATLFVRLPFALELVVAIVWAVVCAVYVRRLVRVLQRV
ncbi:MAG TPA: hypothetical protein VHT03_09840 [Rhizomicrobium sp.]|jgi:hypothetical protein|nr:hypothetical protein [Rhizomicrobium sp.]